MTALKNKYYYYYGEDDGGDNNDDDDNDDFFNIINYKTNEITTQYGWLTEVVNCNKHFSLLR